MRRFLGISVLVLSFVLVAACAFAQTEQQVTTQQTTTCSKPFDGRLKLQAYAEYINFTGGDIDHSAWGGGILARYLFLDWLGAQTNVTWYGDVETKNIGGDLSFANWRLTLLAHTYMPAINDKLYVYGGPGVGVQFNDDVGAVEIDNPWTWHVLAGLGYDITELFNVEAEIGYQSGKADAKNFTDDEIGVEALFVRLGGGVRF